MSIFDFSEFDSFYKIYNPLTPYGKIEKSEKKLYFSEHHLKNEYNLISKTIPLLSTDSAKTVSLEYHLKRIPNLNFLANQTFTVTEIFQIKKFLINFKIISEKLPKNISDLFLLKFKSYKLLELLNINNNSETFYLSEKYSCKLAEIRAKIKCFDVELSILKKNRIEGIRSKYSFDFRFQDFIVINESKAINLDDKYFYKESYDSNSVVIKPVYQSEYFTLHHKKAELMKEEKKAEQEVILKLSVEITNEKKQLKKYITVIHKFDVIFAKAVLAEKYDMKQTVLQKYGNNIEIRNGVCIPVKGYCSELNIKYYPLNVSFNNRMIVISGSNMGGKTVVLKTIAFLQLLTQMGFYVPADEYKTTIFDNLHYIGDLKHKHTAGLSSYGMEIYSFINSSSNIKEKALYLIDEFAGTTNSYEAEALISAILYEFSTIRKAYAFLSTHFMNLPEFKYISFFRMKGLDYDKFEKYYRTQTGYDFTERIKLINSFMRYEIEHDIKRDSCYDALKIAEILGLDNKIITQAEKFLKNKKS